MITVKLQGGLGNQLFQISAAYALAIENNDELVLDPNNHFLPLQGRNVSHYRDTILRKINFEENLKIDTTYHEPNFSFNPIDYVKGQMLVGFLQSEKYFKKYADEIRELFAIDDVTLLYIKEKHGKILQDLNSVSIHVRRGDYLKLQNVHPVCDSKYYGSSIKEFSPSSTFYVFSDDVEWCQETFKHKRFKIIDENDIISLYLMSMCKDNIIANSSFSWWGAWLNRNDNKKVIAPQRWFGDMSNNATKDLIPSEWELK